MRLKMISLLARTHGHHETHLLIDLFAAIIAAAPQVLKKTLGQKNVFYTIFATSVWATLTSPLSMLNASASSLIPHRPRCRYLSGLHAASRSQPGLRA